MQYIEYRIKIWFENVDTAKLTTFLTLFKPVILQFELYINFARIRKICQIDKYYTYLITFGNANLIKSD